MKLDQHMAVELAVIENQIQEVIAAPDADLLLPILEAESISQFEQELLQVIEQGGLQIVFTENLLRLEPEKFKNVGILDDVGG